MDLILNFIIPFIIILSILVFVHEMGHYLFARWFGVKVEAFSIGFGRELLGWNDKHGTRWKLCLIPFGGYVQLFGFSDEASVKAIDESNLSEEEKKVSMQNKKLYQKALIVFGGPLFNYIFSVVLLALLFGFVGQSYTSTKVSEIMPDSAAAAAGLKEGDVITTMNGGAVTRFEQIKRFVQLRPEEPIEMDVTRGEQQLKLTITPQVKVIENRVFGTEQKIGLIGIKSEELVWVKHGPAKAVKYAVVEVYDLTLATLKALAQIFTGTRSFQESFVGPAGIAKMSGDAVAQGIESAVYFTALVSMSLGLINLFPIPVLDGGHLMFYAYEAIFRRPPNEKVQGVAVSLGFGLIILLILFTTWNDLTNLRVLEQISSWLS